MIHFDLISDIHLDFWLKRKGPTLEDNLREIDSFVESLLPQEMSHVLVIAGDLGHFNKQNDEMLRSLKRFYAHILVVAGNHDYYLVNSKVRYKLQTSMNRWSEMKSLASGIEGVHYLEGDIFEWDGVRYGGVGMWYDFSYGTNVLGRSLNFMLDIWANQMNDRNYTIGSPRRPMEFFWEQKEKLDRIIHDSDVIITHVSPDWSQISAEHAGDPISGCYYFDGSGYFSQIDGKVWCSGHVHLNHSYKSNGCLFVNNALGYPNENNRPKGRIINVITDSNRK
ncbi:metallophosphoesterase family protein [Paenibacillus ihuae]|uniref:metallophosphoesterase family protein n=1 Tax=Paenibacillus ihuae TaxID=1232431 RepID=UPI0006D53E8B|nr:metallophosphoesterase [Paenibacillus ihuae]